MIPFIVVVEPKGQRCRTDVVLVRGDRPKTDEEVASTLVEADRLLERGDPRGEALLALLRETPYITVHPHLLSDHKEGWPELQIHNVLLHDALGGVEAGLRLLMDRLDIKAADYAVTWSHMTLDRGDSTPLPVRWCVTVRQVLPVERGEVALVVKGGDVRTTEVKERHTELIATRQLNDAGTREVVVVRVSDLAVDILQVTAAPRRLTSSFLNSSFLGRRETTHVQLAQEDDAFFTE